MRRLFPLLLVLVCFPLFAYAASTSLPSHIGYTGESRTELSDMTLDELFQVKITGSTLTPRALKTVPSAVTVFTHEEISRLGLDSLDELMNLVPGYQSYRSSITSVVSPFSSRGRRIGNVGAAVLVLVDGQRIEDLRTNGSFSVIPKFPLAGIEHVEFIRGPGSAVYGSNAMMGIVNIVTRTNANELSVERGSFGHYQASVLAASQVGDVQVDFHGRFNVDDGDVYSVRDGSSSNRIDTHDPRELMDLYLKLRWKGTQLHFQHNEHEAEDFYLATNLNDGFTKMVGWFDSASLKHDFEWGPMKSFAWLSYSSSKSFSRIQSAPPGSFAGISNPPSSAPLRFAASSPRYSEIRTQWHNDWDIDEESSLQFGVEYRHLELPETVGLSNYSIADLANGNFPIRSSQTLSLETTFQLASQRDIVGLYAQYQRQFMEETHLTLGLRYDDFSGIGSEFSPRLGVVRELGDNHSFKFLYGEAFRAPTEAELNMVNNPNFKGSPDLSPETVKTLDLIWIGQWEHMYLSLGYFENHFSNSIISISLPNGINQSENTDLDPTKGVEFELSRELTENWMLRGTYTHLTQKPDLSFREADDLMSLYLNYNHPSWNANLIAVRHGNRESPRGGGGRIKLNDYWQLNGKVIYEFSEKMQGYVQVKNALDEDYQTPAASAALLEGIPNRGREILVGMKWEF